MLQGLYFGAKLLYCSPTDGHKTPCVYIREDGGRAVVIFQNAEWVARVNHDCLEWKNESNYARSQELIEAMNEEIRKMKG